MKDHKLAAIVFTDIVGYTSRMEKDETHTMDLLSRQREIVFPLVKEYNGEVIKEIGDGLLMMFTSAIKAVRFAMALQSRLDEEELTIRAGIHIGDVIFEEGDVFGSAVNIAARIEPLASSGGICVSEDVYSQIRNKEDIHAVSIGKKNLKGVDGLMEIYKVFIDDDIPEPRTAVSFFRDLWYRRVPQILLVYLLISYLLKLLMSSLVSHYFLSPYLVDLTWILLLSLVPSVLIISYFHGRKGVSRWKKLELIGMPINLALSLLIVVFVFKGKDLGATTTSVKLEKEDGSLVERVIPKTEFRKRIAIFNFQNQSSDTSIDFLQYAIPSMTEYDLSQDLFITSQAANQFFDQMRDAGYPDGIGLPLTLIKNLAARFHMGFFLAGELSIQDNQYRVDCKLYVTEHTNLIAEFSLENEDIFKLVDILSKKIKKEVGLPESHIQETTDLPVAEIYTSSFDALRLFSEGVKYSIFNDYEKAVHYLDKAIETDPGFAVAYLIQTLFYFDMSLIENAQHSIEKAMQHLVKLPERQQYFVKFLYYLFRQEAEKAMKVVQMWVELYPDDLQGRTTLAQRYYFNNMFEEAIQQYKAILQLAPEQYDVLNSIANIYLEMALYDSALHYYKLYADEFPQQHESYLNLGNFYLKTAHAENAGENFEKALLLAPLKERPGILVKLGNTDLIAGNLDKAYDQYMDALSYSKNARDSNLVFFSMQKYYELKGQYDTALKYYELGYEAMKRYAAPKDYLAARAFTIEIYVDAGESEKAIAILDELRTQLEPPLDNIVPYGYMFVYSHLGETDKAEEAIVGATQLARDFGQEGLLLNVVFIQGRIHEKKEGYEQAITYYERFLEDIPNNYEVYKNIARCYRKLGKLNEAEEYIQKCLEMRPAYGMINYEAALIYLTKGDTTRALEYLETANEVWKDADADFEMAEEARKKLEALRAGV